jgi:hypothetical protein
MIVYLDIFLAALNLFNFYAFVDNSIYLRGLNLACCLISSLCAIKAMVEKK